MSLQGDDEGGGAGHGNAPAEAIAFPAVHVDKTVHEVPAASTTFVDQGIASILGPRIARSNPRNDVALIACECVAEARTGFPFLVMRP